MGATLQKSEGEINVNVKPEVNEKGVHTGEYI